MWLTPDDVQRLTGAKQRKLQAARLRRMGVPFRLNALGEPLVEPEAVRVTKRKERAQEPNWSALHG
jgi:hypothetical protein